MTLYFKNGRGNIREIYRNDDVSGEDEIQQTALKEIYRFCDDKNFKVYYIRMWNVEEDGKFMTCFDVGSHVEFFFLDPAITI